MERPNTGNTQIQFKYEDFMQGEGIPIHKEISGVDDVTALPRRPWARTGGLGTFIELTSTFQSERGMFVCEIPGGNAVMKMVNRLKNSAAVVLLAGTSGLETCSGVDIKPALRILNEILVTRKKK